MINLDTNKTTYCFMNQTFRDKNNDFCLAQIIFHEEFSFEVRTITMTLEEAKTLRDNYRNHKNIIFDFDFEDGYIKASRIPSTQISDEEIGMLKEKETKFAPNVKNIYELFYTLVDHKGMYVADEVLDEFTSEEFVKGCINFLPKYSKSSMTVYIPIKLKDGWHSKKLIYTEDGALKLSKFHFIIPTQYKHVIDKFSVKALRNINIDKQDYTLYELLDASIYAYIPRYLEIYDSILNKYTYISRSCNDIIKIMHHFIRIFTTAIEPNDTAIQTEEVTQHRPEYKSRYSKYKVIIADKVPQFKLDDWLKYADIINKQVRPVYKKYGNNFNVVYKLLDNTKPKLGYYDRQMFTVLSQYLLESGDSELDRLTGAKKLHRVYSIKKFKADTYLYMIRSCLFIYSQDFFIGYGDQRRLRGSDVSYENILKREVMRVE